MPGIYTSSYAILLPFLQAFGLKINLGSQMATNPWLVLVQGLSQFSDSCGHTLLFRPRTLENKDIESAFVVKYEITLDECLA